MERLVDLWQVIEHLLQGHPGRLVLIEGGRRRRDQTELRLARQVEGQAQGQLGVGVRLQRDQGARTRGGKRPAHDRAGVDQPVVDRSNGGGGGAGRADPGENHQVDPGFLGQVVHFVRRFVADQDPGRQSGAAPTGHPAKFPSQRLCGRGRRAERDAGPHRNDPGDHRRPAGRVGRGQGEKSLALPQGFWKDQNHRPRPARTGRRRRGRANRISHGTVSPRAGAAGRSEWRPNRIRGAPGEPGGRRGRRKSEKRFPGRPARVRHRARRPSRFRRRSRETAGDRYRRPACAPAPPPTPGSQSLRRGW